ncbi:Wzz/FepE/Etk N-terminal domain-containing protein [Variovorax sp. UC122_21]|uniref:Wzz/FepE/Etk N-terminal domain-containing protein n=1 Tax=Variovorax sp. UC122_21 TaxID=3374554 RepID=UPI003756E45F
MNTSAVTIAETSSNSILYADRDEDQIHIAEYIDILLDHKWRVAAVTIFALLIGIAYALLATPVY